MRTEQNNVEKQVAPVEFVAQVADCERGRSAHREEGRRHVSPKIPAIISGLLMQHESCPLKGFHSPKSCKASFRSDHVRKLQPRRRHHISGIKRVSCHFWG